MNWERKGNEHHLLIEERYEEFELKDYKKYII